LKRCFGDSIVLHTCALSDHDGQAELAIPQDLGGQAILGHATLERRFDGDPRTQHVKVPIRPLDSLEFDRVGFIKIDVEGHEEEALRGAQQLLQRDGPSILVEAEDRHKAGAVQRLRLYLESLGYLGFFYFGGRLRSISAFDPKTLQVPGKDPYIGNFIFVKRNEVLQRIAGLLET
jgi:FkbM family methyltransferase